MHRSMFIAVAIMLQTLGIANAEGPEQVLIDDFSRGQLFALEIKAEGLAGKAGQFALPLPFTFPRDIRGDSVFGIDVSHHNQDDCTCTIQWSLLPKNKVDFVYAKASQGLSYYDRTFSNSW